MGTSIRVGVVGVLLFVMAVSAPVYAQNKKLMTVEAAKKLADRAIVESIVGLKVKSDTKVEDLIAQEHKVDAKTSAAVTGIEYTDITYDPAKDIAKVTAQIKVGRVKNVLENNINYGDITVERVAFATSTPSNAAPLKALRAAEIDAYEKMAKTLVGYRIDSKTSVENFVLKSDEVRSKLLAAIYGAKLLDFNWDADGNAHVRLSLKADYVRDVLGQRFTCEQPEIIVEGTGAQQDDFSTTQANDGVVRKGEIKEGTIAVPLPNTAQDKATGGAADTPKQP